MSVHAYGVVRSLGGRVLLKLAFYELKKMVLRHYVSYLVTRERLLWLDKNRAGAESTHNAERGQETLWSLRHVSEKELNSKYVEK